MPSFAVLSRSETSHTRSRGDDRFVVSRGAPRVGSEGTLARELEYVRALRAAKLSRHLARPFLGALEGHADAVTAMALAPPHNASALASGGADGAVWVWDMPSRRPMWTCREAHSRGFVRGLCVLAIEPQLLVSCGDDGAVRLWSLASGEALHEHLGSEGSVMACDAHPISDEYATAGESIQLWRAERPDDAVARFVWASPESESHRSVRYNPAEPNILASVAGSERSLALYDTRQPTPLRRMIQAQRNNALAWNPYEPLNFTTANEDGRLYTFDMRRLDGALQVHHGHVSAVLDVHYAPTGREFVTAGHDRSIRIFSWRDAHNREVYTAPRMQRVSCVRFSLDARFVVSGSDDFRIRVWKARAARPIGPLVPRERVKLDYAASLIERYQHQPDVRAVLTKRKLPKLLYKQTRAEREAGRRTREKRVRAMQHTRPEHRTEERPTRVAAVLKVE